MSPQTTCLVIGLLSFAWLSPVTHVDGQDKTSTTDDWRSRLSSKDIDVRRRAAIDTLTLDRSARKALLEEMIERLKVDHDGQVRLALMTTLTDMGADAEPTIEVLLTSMRKNFGGRHNEEIHQDYRAALALSAIGPPSVEPLRELLSPDERINVRAEAIMALGRIGGPAVSSVDDLIRLLADEETRLREEAMTALGRIGDAALPKLIVAARHEDEQIRAGAVAAIGAMESHAPDNARVILDSVMDASALVRSAAVKSLPNVEVPDERRSEILVAAVSDSEPSVRLSAVNVLVDDPELLRGLKASLRDRLTADDDGVAWHAAFLLQRIGPDATQVLLESAVEDGSRVEQLGEALSLIGPQIVNQLHTAMQQPHGQVREAAAVALGAIRPVDPRTVQVLADGLADEEQDVQNACLRSIGRLGSIGRSAIQEVRAKLNHESSQTRQTAIDVLTRIARRDQTLVNDLIKMADDQDDTVQRKAIEAITATGPIGRPALPIVIERLASSDSSVRNAAVLMIGSHGGGAGEALPALTKMLEDQDVQWRVTIVKTIAKLGTSAKPAAEELASLLDDSSAVIRESALDALGDIGLAPSDLVPLVRKGLQDDDYEVRSRAIRTFRQLGENSMELLNDLIVLADVEQHQRWVNRTLERLEQYLVNPVTVPRLQELANHDSQEVQLHAIRFLGYAGPAASAAIPMLNDLAEREDKELRETAVAAIEKIEADRSETPSN